MTLPGLSMAPHWLMDTRRRLSAQTINFFGEKKNSAPASQIYNPPLRLQPGPQLSQVGYVELLKALPRARGKTLGELPCAANPTAAMLKRGFHIFMFEAKTQIHAELNLYLLGQRDMWHKDFLHVRPIDAALFQPPRLTGCHREAQPHNVYQVQDPFCIRDRLVQAVPAIHHNGQRTFAGMCSTFHPHLGHKLPG